MSREGIKARIYELITEYYAGEGAVFEPGKSKIGVGLAYYDHEEVIRVLEVLFSGWISLGREVARFEEMFAQYVGVPHAAGINSGSSANLLALAALVENGDAPPGSEVIVPSATFTTVVSPIIQVGLSPVFVDVDPLTYNIDPCEIRKAINEKTRVIMPVHTLGYPAAMDEIMRIAQEHDLKVLEDCCEAHGTEYYGQRVGSFGDLATFSFFVAHNMTTGEGGMVTTPHSHYDKVLRSLREFGRFQGPVTTRFAFSDGTLNDYDERYVFQRMGYNLRMTNITAAFGIEQLKKLDGMNARRIETTDYYLQHLRPFEKFIQLPSYPAHVKHTFYAFPMVIKENGPFCRAEFARYLEKHQIETRALFGGSLADQPAYRQKGIRVIGDLRVSRWLRDYAVFIGCHPGIREAEREYVVSVIHKFISGF